MNLNSNSDVARFRKALELSNINSYGVIYNDRQKPDGRRLKFLNAARSLPNGIIPASAHDRMYEEFGDRFVDLYTHDYSIILLLKPKDIDD